MPATKVALLALILATILIDLYIVFNPRVVRDVGGKVLAFIGLLVFPTLAVAFGMQDHMESSKSTDYCLSCHVMDTHGKSLLVDDAEFLPAAHFQNKRIPRNQACYTCHTEYTMYGDVSSKIRGLHHVFTQYLGTVPDTLHLEQAYQNRECLHCHLGGRQFESAAPHRSGPGTLDSLITDRLSCITSGCHDVLHNKGDLKGLVVLDRDSLLSLERPGK